MGAQGRRRGTAVLGVQPTDESLLPPNNDKGRGQTLPSKTHEPRKDDYLEEHVTSGGEQEPHRENIGQHSGALDAGVAAGKNITIAQISDHSQGNAELPLTAAHEQTERDGKKATEGTFEGAAEDPLAALYEKYLDDYGKQQTDLCQFCEKIEGACDPLNTVGVEHADTENSTMTVHDHAETMLIQHMCHAAGCCKSPGGDFQV